MKNPVSETFAAARRGLPGLAAAVAFTAILGMNPVTPASAASDAAQRIADHFSSVATMSGEFVQFGPRGEQTGGKFYIQRRLGIGYNRAASIIEKMEKEGIVGPANHAGKREILVPTEEDKL